MLALGFASGAPQARAMPAGSVHQGSGARPLARGGPLTALDSAQASALAASTGQPVEIMADRTDSSQTYAEPGGGFLAQESALPYQVQRPDGSWVQVDTTLSAQPDGSVAPAATVTGLRLSGGGSGPLYTVTSAAGEPTGSVSVTWPYGPLPAPTLSGSTAEYASVLPGVNLLVTAEPLGVEATLQVLNAAAAGNPDLANISFGVSAPGLAMSPDGYGGLVLKNAAGNSMFGEPAAQMWDSAAPAPPGGATLSTPSGGLPAGMGGPVPGDHVGTAAAQAGPGSVTLTPNAAVLSGPSAVYPVFIDPGTFDSHTQTGWLEIGHNFAGGVNGSCSTSWTCYTTWDYEDSNGGIRSGVWCNGPPGGGCSDPTPDQNWGLWRTYMNFNVPGSLYGAGFVGARLFLNEMYAASCTPTDLDLVQTDLAKQGMTWDGRPGQDTVLDTKSLAGGYDASGNKCGSSGVELDASSALTSIAKDPTKPGTVTLELRADLSAEGSPDYKTFKKFQATGASNPCDKGSAPCLQVFWLDKPDQATANGTETTFDAQHGTFRTQPHCATTLSTPDYVGTASPTADGTVTDDQSTVSLKGWVHWSQVTGMNQPTSGNNGPAAVDATTHTFGQQVTGPATGYEYGWQAYGQATAQDPFTGVNQTQTGTYSAATCYFTVDTLAPAGTVNASATPASPVVGQQVSVALTDPNYSDDTPLAGYYYGIGTTSPAQYVQAASSGPTTVTIKPFTISPEPLYVQAVDQAGNRGPLMTDSQGHLVASATIQAVSTPSNISTLGYWPLNNTTADASGLGNALTLAPAPNAGTFPCPSSTNPPGYRCTLAGEADTKSPVVSAEAGFTVSAWVSTGGADCGQAVCVAMSEDATKVSVFALGYEKTCAAGPNGCWVFSVWSGDQAGLIPYTVTAAAQPGQLGSGVWTQLTGEYDPSLNHQTLYVNGNQMAQQGGPTPWRVAQLGMLRLGGTGFPSTSTAEPWPAGGTVSDACVFYGPLPQTAINTLYTGTTGTPPNPDGCQVVAGQYMTP
jgi:hypothetical protein